MSEKLIDVESVLKNSYLKKFYSVIQSPFEKMLSVDKVNDLYLRSSRGGENEFFEVCLEEMGTRYVISDEDMEKIPREGALVTVSNHPFGGIEGIIMGALMLRIRKDVKILGNYLLQRIKPIKNIVIPVDPFGFKDSPSNNIKGLKEALGWLRNGGALISFPSGKVSYFHLNRMEISDPDWSTHIAAIIRKTRATVQSFYFPGKNGSLFQAASVVPRLRTILLPRELMNKTNKKIEIYAGKQIQWKKIRAYDDNEELINFLRINTYFLKNRKKAIKTSLPQIALQRKAKIKFEETIPPVPENTILEEIENLPDKQFLLESGKFRVYIAEADQIPDIMLEIGRLREVTYRNAKEGTGKKTDLDEYDKHYLHIFLWDLEAKLIVGSYRIGKADEIISKHGFPGLYTSTLFRFKSDLIKHLLNAVELGRSFIRTEYQKTPSALALLWRGIGEFILKNEKYYKLFGMVSISQDYHMVSQNLIVQFIKNTRQNSELAKYVIPRYPFSAKNLSANDRVAINSTLKDIDDVSLLISELEEDGKGVPVLLRHYLKFNAKILHFSIDVNFMNVLDGLLMVDLRETDAKLMNRFMGNEGYEKFCRANNIQKTETVLKTA